MDQEETPNSFGRLLDEIAEEDQRAFNKARLDLEARAALAARIALAMAAAPDRPSRNPPPGLHARFIDADDEPAEMRRPLPRLPSPKPGTTKRELERLRRAFALANHPDIVPPGEREEATRRMAAFNRMIDEKLARV